MDRDEYFDILQAMVECRVDLEAQVVARKACVRMGNAVPLEESVYTRVALRFLEFVQGKSMDLKDGDVRTWCVRQPELQGSGKQLHWMYHTTQILLMRAALTLFQQKLDALQGVERGVMVAGGEA